MGGECGKARVDGYQFRPHDGTGLFRPRSIYVDSSVGGDVHNRRPQAWVSGDVRAVGVDPLLR